MDSKVAASKAITSAAVATMLACVRKLVVRYKRVPGTSRTPSPLLSATQATAEQQQQVLEQQIAQQQFPGQQAWEVVRLANGLVSLEETPPWLVNIVERNAQESPLLRLPGEIRMMIWQYVLTGAHVNVSMWWSQITCDGLDEACVCPLKPRPWRSLLRGSAEDSAVLRLPQVCRAIYFDTAPIAYQGIIFFFDSHTERDIWAWAKQLEPARRNAITDIALCKAYLRRHHVPLGHYQLLSVHPALQHIHVYGTSGYKLYIRVKEAGI